MKPLPAQVSANSKASSGIMPSLPAAISAPTGTYSTANRRTSTCSVQRAYPWLLIASTTVAALFCLMYITKPVIMTSTGNNLPVPPPIKPELAPLPKETTTPVTNSSLIPSSSRLPGESPILAKPREVSPPTKASSPFEETNLKIQHVLTAEAPGGPVARIDIDVPVLYQSRNLLWQASEVAEARNLLLRLSDYQEKSRLLRAEGIELLESWNRLVERSIPTGDLRADSPTLPINQQDAADSPRPAGLSSTESIQIQPAGK